MLTRTALLVCAALAACGDAAATTTPTDAGDPGDGRCGPAEGVVAEVIDGDTVRLESGEKIRYLMVDTPEITNGKNDCYGAEARDYNAELVLHQQVTLTYDEECSDAYDRLLAYVETPDGEVNKLMVERGFACVLYIPPNGRDRQDEFTGAELAARQSLTGMWGACGDVACD